MIVKITKNTDDISTINLSHDDNPTNTFNVFESKQDLKGDDIFGAMKQGSSGLLPPALRWINASRDTIIFERPPHSVTLRLKRVKLTDTDFVNEEVYTINLPWTVYISFLDNKYNPIHCYVFARNSTLVDLDDKVYLLPIPNLYQDGSLCLPTQASFVYNPNRTIADAIADTYNLIWHSGFNYDLIDCLNAALRQRSPKNFFRSIDRVVGWDQRLFRIWSEASPEEVISMDWPIPLSHYQRNIGLVLTDNSLSRVLQNARETHPEKLSNPADPINFMVQIVNSINRPR